MNLIEMLIDVEAVKYGNFTLVSGKPSTYYVDLKKAYTNPKILQLMCEDISNCMKNIDNVDSVAGIEIGGIPIATAVSLELNLPMVILRKAEKDYGTKGLFIGDVQNKRIVLLDDVTTTGNTIIDGIKNIREAGGIVEFAISIVDRNEGAIESLKNIDVNLMSIINSADLKSDINL